ncbi:unnamed protein product, partial [Mesorhabditis belari]|uniref:LRRCT domain-containing protein n=1 Tax=Mesorhabditis belari TaxID=2138241 RepID=A0AAF3ERX3_9BILA
MIDGGALENGSLTLDNDPVSLKVYDLDLDQDTIPLSEHRGTGRGRGAPQPFPFYGWTVIGVLLTIGFTQASKRPHHPHIEDPNSRFACIGSLLADQPACQCREDDGELSCINAQFIETRVFLTVNNHYKHLSKITFHGNNFQDLPQGSLFGDVIHSSLTTLNISANYIVNLHSGALKGVPNLRVLDLSNNEIVLKEENVDFLTHTPHLTELYLRRAFTATLNRTQQFDLMMRMFKRANLQKLLILDLSYNFLDTIPSQLPCPFPSLQKLDLRQNFLEDLPVNASCLKNMGYLDLSRNQFHQPSKALRQLLGRLPENSVNFRNSFHCDCKSAEYIQWIRSTRAIREKTTLICDKASPKSLQGRRLTDVPINELDCSLPLLINPNSSSAHFDFTEKLALFLFLFFFRVFN